MSEIDVPAELLQQIRTGNSILGLGAGISIGARGAPSGAEMARELAEQCGYSDEDLSLPRVAQYYEMKMGRHALNQYVINRLSSPPCIPQKAHKIITELPFQVITTTNFDRLLEQQLDAYGVPYSRILRTEHIAYSDPTKLIYVKFHGSIEDPDTLVITEDDYLQYFRRLPAMSINLQALLATKTLLFVGYSLADANFKRTYDELLNHVDRHMRRAYAIQAHPSSYDLLWWRASGRNVQIIDADGAEFLSAIRASIPNPRPLHVRYSAATPMPREPYKFLDYFDDADRAVFFGRHAEMEALVGNVLAHNVTVVYGPSGAGKTSLIRAGAIPRLHDEGYETIYLRVLKDPFTSLIQELDSENFRMQDELNPVNITQLLASRLGENARVVIIFDQFEELFIRHGKAVRRNAGRFIQACQMAESLDLRLLLAIRDDYFVKLEDLFSSGEDLDIFDYRIKLGNLSAEQARTCIREPARLFGVTFEENLLNQLIEDLDDNGIEPAQLQIVCHSLFEARSPDRPIIGSDLYESLGGTNGILANYLDDVLRSFRSEIEREAAKGILKQLVSYEQTKEVVTTADLIRETAGHSQTAREVNLRLVLDQLRARRVIRKVPRQDAYELAHDVLVTRVWDWVSSDEAIGKSVRAILRQALGDSQMHEVEISNAKFELINQNREKLILNTDEARFMFRVAMSAGSEIAYWLCTAARAAVGVIEEATAILEGPHYRSREGLLLCLEHFEAIEQCMTLNQRLELLETALLCPWDATARAARRILEWINSPRARSILARHPPRSAYVHVQSGRCVVGRDASPIMDVFEGPAHEVDVAGFWICRYPVTNAEYQEFVDATGHRVPEHWTGRRYPAREGEHPVVYVSWIDARDYCRWLTGQSEGIQYRLPTEVEWEKAASWDPAHGTRAIFAYGNDFDKSKCNTREGGVGEPTPIGEYSSVGGDSVLGLSDMTGNVWEWTNTRAASSTGHIFAYPYDPADGREDDSDDNAIRVLRGGSCYNTQANGRCSYRFRITPHYRNGDIGFRIAADRDPGPTS